MANFCPPGTDTGYFIDEEGNIISVVGDEKVEAAARRYLQNGDLNPHWISSTVYWTLEAAQDAQNPPEEN